MRLLLDQGLPRSAAGLLRDSGIDAIHVGEIGMAAAKDADILQYAKLEERAVVTLDADFHALLALSSAVSPSVIRIRIEGLRGAECAALIQTILTQCQPDIEAGSVLTVQDGRIRIRRLPIG